MELTPLYAGDELSVAQVKVLVNPKDRARAEALVSETSKLKTIARTEDLQAVKRAAGQCKAMLNEIEDAKKAAKRPFGAVEAAINDLASEVSDPVESEHKRLLGLLNAYVARVEAEEREELRRKREQAEQEQREAQARIQAARNEQALLEAEMQLELSRFNPAPPPAKGKITGGRVDHPWTYKVINIAQVIEKYGTRLIRWELDILACNDEVRRQLAEYPDRDPVIPGLQVERKVNVSVKAQAATGNKRIL
jgi:hypothetical protein